MKLIFCFLFAALVGGSICKKVQYNGYSVIRVTPNTEEQVRVLRFFENKSNGLSFWTNVNKVGKHVDVMVPPHMSVRFEEAMNNVGITVEEFIPNVQELIDNEQGPSVQDDDFQFNQYHTLEELYSYLDSVVAQQPDIASIIIGGSTYENRDIKGIKISYKSGNPGVFVETGIHAREWIGPATVVWMLNQLLVSQDPNVRDIAESYDWYIFPSVNPDGYAYTHTTDRLWRGTRSKGTICYGCDPNRNWDFHWLEGGASDYECDETYAGKSPFSEVETRSLSQYYSQIQQNIKVYLSFHSYSQLLMFPYGYTDNHIPDFSIHNKIGMKAASVLSQRYGTQYDVGDIAETIYIASGSSLDWIKGTYNTSLTYTYELRDTGRYGFVLPANQIIPTAEETLDSVVSMLQDAKDVHM